MPRSRRYLVPSTKQYLTAADLKRGSEDIQIEAMRHWFGQNFDPPDELPHDSREGGYQWIWGGPYDAYSMLDSQFGHALSQEVIDKLGSELSDESPEWSGKPNDEDLYDDDYVSDLIAKGTDPYMTLLGSLGEIEDAAKINPPEDKKRVLHKLLYANTISAFETFLSDLFIKTLGKSDQYVEDFVFKTPHFRAIKIELSDIFLRFKKIDVEVRNYVLAHNWHRLNESAEMYKRAFGVSFPAVSETIKNGIRDRHDIVHRNGKTSEGVAGTWGLAQIQALKEAIIAFSHELNDRVFKLLPHKPDDSEDETITI